jgi:hypothetical protein
LFKSVDAGATWSMMQSGKFIDMELIPTTSTLIATTVGWGPKAYRSTDFGQTWTLVYQGNVVEEYRCDVAVTPASTSTVYIITDWGNSLDALYGIFKSTDAGNSFTKVYDGAVSNNLYGWNATNTENDGGQGWYDVAFAVSNTNANVVYVGGVNGYVSLDGALTFDVCNGWSSYVGADVVHADHHNAYFRPSDNRLFDVNDGGVYYSDNVTLGKTSSWISITDGIVTGQIYDIGVSQATVGTIVAGFQDNGTKLLTPASTDWKIVKSGDGMECAIDTKNTAIQWGTYVELQVSQTTNTWGSSTSLRNSGTAQWAGPLESDPNGGGYVYIGTSGVEVYPNTTIPVKSTVIDEKAPAKFVSLSGTLDGTNFLNTLDIYNDGVNRVIWAASPAGCWKSPGTTGAGTYIYTETSNGNINKTALLSSPDIDLSAYTGTQVTFLYHMYGSTMVSLSIDLYYNGINHTSVPVYWQSLGTTATIISGTQLEQWFQATVDVSAADGASDFKFTFHAVTGTDAYGDMAIDDFTVTGTQGSACTPPTIQASNFSSTPSLNTISTSWLRGNGDKVLVVARQGSAVNADPISGTTYTANSTFGSGTQIGTGNYVVYNVPATSVTVTGLTAGTLYYFAIYEYNSTGLCYKIPALTASATTSFGGRTIIDSDKATIYPNPNRGTFNINVNYEYTDYKVELRTITGQVIYANKFENLGTKEIILNNATPGIYFLKIYFNDNTSADYKVIIQ